MVSRTLCSQIASSKTDIIIDTWAMIFPSRSQLASKQIRRTGRAEAVTKEGLAATLLPGRQPDQMGQRHSLRPVRPRSCPGPLRKRVLMLYFNTNVGATLVYRSALRARPLQSGRAPRRRNQPRAGAHGARVERREPRTVPRRTGDRQHRFIPAREGNGTPIPILAIITSGSSPRVRGTGLDCSSRHRWRRFIPARAGNGPSMAGRN